VASLPDSITIRHLLDEPQAVPVLARWFVQEWEPYYGPDGPGDAETDLRAAYNRDQLPICLVALDAARDVVGTIALRAESLPSHRHLTPWLAGLLVAPSQRRQGIGTALIAVLEAEARRLGYSRLYTATDTARGQMKKRGWRAMGEAPTLRGPATVYVLDL
jgi:GNAT superfamily N-acetyltransferase